jgi:hypothetical protein
VQANPDAIYAAPEGNYADVDGDLTGGGVAGQNVIVFTANRTYRLSGVYDSTGAGGINPIEISRTVGCISHKSIVQTQQGCFFAARDGFYFTDGYSVLRISEDLPSTYSSISETEAQGKMIYGTYDPYSKQVLWAASSDSANTDNDRIFVAHTYFGISPNTPFTRWSGGEWESNFQPSAISYDEDERYLIRGDTRGYVLVQSDSYTDDTKIDTSVTPDTWLDYPVIYDYIGPSTDCGSVAQRKFGTKLVVNATSVGRVTIMPYSNNDNGASFIEMSEIKSPWPVYWGDDVEWGDTRIRWNSTPITSGLRRFPQRSARFSYKQVRLKNSYTVVTSSDILGSATFNNTANTITLDDVTKVWPTDAVDFYVSSSADNYFNEFLVTARTSDTVLTLSDSANILPTGSYSWKLKGYRKREGIRLESYSAIFQMLTPSQAPYRGE